MIAYSREPDAKLEVGEQKIACFHTTSDENIDPITVDSFGEEWSKFSEFEMGEINQIGNEYFDLVDLNSKSDQIALDVGCGSGRWSLFASQHFKFVEAIDPSKAVLMASKASEKVANLRVSQASVDQIPFADESFDFVFSLGVLHHIPDTEAAMIQSVKKLKMGGQFLVYLYYSLDNRGIAFRTLFHLSNSLRWFISKMPSFLKKTICDLIAILVYLPFVFLAQTLKKLGISTWKKVPLSYYVGKSFFVIRNDALDRFGTPLEQRFSKNQIEKMMKNSGLKNIRFSENTPYWHAVGEKT